MATESNTAPAPEAHLPPALQADRGLLEMIGDWRIHRAQQTLVWAQNEQRESLGDTSYEVDTNELGMMKTLEDLIGAAEPKSMRAVVKMLGVAHTILSHEDPKAYMADGPVVEILRNVIEALEYCDSGEPVGQYRLKTRNRHIDDGNGEIEEASGDVGGTDHA